MIGSLSRYGDVVKWLRVYFVRAHSFVLIRGLIRHTLFGLGCIRVHGLFSLFNPVKRLFLCRRKALQRYSWNAFCSNSACKRRFGILR